LNKRHILGSETSSTNLLYDHRTYRGADKSLAP